jgi:gas vesicle protein
MSDRDNTDLWTALTIGAVVGIGAALLVRARQSDTDTIMLARRLKPVRKAARAARDEVGRRTRHVADAGEDLLDAGREILDDLRQGARDIVKATREELQKAARESVADARKAARKARRTLG